MKDFPVISHYDGEPVHCSYCLQVAPRIAILRIPDGDEVWLCQSCVSAMVNALAQGPAT